MREFNELREFKKFSFKSNDEQEIISAVKIFEKLGYHTHDQYFNAEDATLDDGFCTWDNGEMTEGWLDTYSGFKQVTLEELKEMVGENEEVLWLNKNTLEEKYLRARVFLRGVDWVEVPDGATFATGDKDNFVFRKDGWYYEDGEWVKTELTFDKVGNYSQLKLFWVKGGIFTLKRLLGCEVKINYSGVTGYVTDITNNGHFLHICCGNSFDVVSKYYSKFFTEDGDELTFDEYVNMYYGCEDGV